MSKKLYEGRRKGCMKKFIHVGYDVNYGVSGIFQIYSWSIAFVVGGDHQISVYMVCIFKCKSLYQKMHFNQS